MSVQTQIDRINSAKTAIGAAIAGKGVTVPSGTKIDGMAALIGAIQGGGGGGGTHENCIPYEENDTFSYTVDAVSGASYGFALNDAGYYESQNKGKNSSYALCRVNLTVNTACDIEFSVINYAESNYDYGLFGALDKALGKNASEDSGVKKSYKSEHSANAVSLVYENVPAGNHFIDVKFIKDSSGNNNNDSLQFKIVNAGRKNVTISAEYYPIITNTEPVIDAIASIAEKGVDTSGAGFGNIASFVRKIIDRDSSFSSGTITVAEDTAVSTDNPLIIEHNLGAKPYVFLIDIVGTVSASGELAHLVAATRYGEKVQGNSLWIQKGVKRGSSSSNFSLITNGSSSMSSTVEEYWTETTIAFPLTGAGSATFDLKAGKTYYWAVI